MKKKFFSLSNPLTQFVSIEAIATVVAVYFSQRFITLDNIIVATRNYSQEGARNFCFLLAMASSAVMTGLPIYVIVIRIQEWLEHKAFVRRHRRRNLYYSAVDQINDRRDAELLEGLSREE